MCHIGTDVVIFILGPLPQSGRLTAIRRRVSVSDKWALVRTLHLFTSNRITSQLLEHNDWQLPVDHALPTALQYQ